MLRAPLAIGQAGLVAVTLNQPPEKVGSPLTVMEALVDGVTAVMPAGSVQV
jgi:hypothetical protein